MGQQVQQDRLRHQSIGAGDQGLGGDDGRCRAEDDCEGAQRVRQHQEERIQVRNGVEPRVAAVLDDPGALTQVVEDQAHLHYRPAGIDVLLAHMAHVRVQSLRAGSGEKDAAEDHKACLVGRTQQYTHRVEGIEGPQHGRKLQDMQGAREAEEGEPGQHHRPEGPPDAAGAGVLHGEEGRDDEQCDEHHLGLVRAQQPIHGRDAAQALHRRGDRDRRGQNAVGQQRRAAQHGRKDQPLAAVLHQRIEGEDAALAVVVRLHGDQDVFDGGEQRDRPDDQGEGTHDEALIHLTQTAVALQDRLHHVHGGGADIPVDDADRHQKHAEAQLALFLHSFILPACCCPLPPA